MSLATFLVRFGIFQARHMNEMDGFMQECALKYDIDVFDMFCEVFTHLPLAHIVHLPRGMCLLFCGFAFLRVRTITSDIQCHFLYV